MKIAIIETSPFSKTNIDAHVRNSIFLKDYLKTQNFSCDLLFSNLPVYLKKYDIIIFSYASFYFDFKKFEILINHQDSNCKYGWLVNEYNLSPNSYFKNLLSFCISNFPKETKQITSNQLHINLNTWLYNTKEIINKNKYNLIYYGTFRPNREKYFKKYLKSKEIYLSTSNKNQKKFKDIGCTPTFIDKLNWESNKETLSLFKASLYIEDEFTHDNFNNLSNRFYESLYCKNALFFDKSCLNTIKKSKNKIDSFFIVESLEEIQEKINSNNFKDYLNDHLEINKKITIEERNSDLNKLTSFLQNL